MASSRTRVALIPFLLLFIVDAFACGESLYRVGQGVRYRSYSAPLPANVVVYKSDATHRELAQQLEAAGHTVTMIDDEAELATTLADGRYDVVIAPFSHRNDMAGVRTAYLPIAANREEAAAAKASYQRTVAANDDVKSYLRAIHEMLEAGS